MLSSIVLPQHTLADLVRNRLRVLGETQRAVSERARQRGYDISQSYLSQIQSGKVKSVGLEKAQALAAGLDVPISAILPPVDGDLEPERDGSFSLSQFYLLYKKTLEASPDDREFVVSMIQALINRLSKSSRREPA